MKEKASWQSLILYYDLSPLELEVHQPRKLITRLNRPRPYLISKIKNGFLLSPITKQDKDKVLGDEFQKIKYWHQFALDLPCTCLDFVSFINLNTQILVRQEEIIEFEQNYLVDRRIISEVHECLSPKKLADFRLALKFYWSQKNKNLISVKVDKVHNFLLNVFMPVQTSRHKQKKQKP